MVLCLNAVSAPRQLVVVIVCACVCVPECGTDGTSFRAAVFCSRFVWFYCIFTYRRRRRRCCCLILSASDPAGFEVCLKLQ